MQPQSHEDGFDITMMKWVQEIYKLSALASLHSRTGAVIEAAQDDNVTNYLIVPLSIHRELVCLAL